MEGDKLIQNISGDHTVPGVNGNEEKLAELCVERGTVIGNIYFKKSYILKYKWVNGVEGHCSLTCVQRNAYSI